MYEACCNVTTRLALFFAISKCDLCFFFWWRVFRVIYLCALSSWFKCDRSVFKSSARLSRQDAAGRNSSLVGTGVSTPVALAPDSSSDEADIEDCARDDAGEALGELLVHLHIQRVLSAEQLVGSEGGCRWSSERVCARAELSDWSTATPRGQMPGL